MHSLSIDGTSSLLLCLHELGRLHTLRLRICKVSDEALASLSAIKTLRALELVRCTLSSSGLKRLRLEFLETLTVGYCLDDETLDSLSTNMPNLRALGLHLQEAGGVRTQIGEAGLAHLTRLPYLAELLLEYWHSIPRINIPRLQRLTVRLSPVGDLRVLVPLQSLVSLKLEGCRTNGLVGISALVALEELSLEGCKGFKDADLLSLVPRLRVLNAQNTEIDSRRVCVHRRCRSSTCLAASYRKWTCAGCQA
jgi:hypothetical protein